MQIVIEEWLSGRRKQKVHIRGPEEGNQGKAGRTCPGKCPYGTCQGQRTDQAGGRTEPSELFTRWKNGLGLKNVVRMEAYDISNISGFESVGSMVVYEKGQSQTQ